MFCIHCGAELPDDAAFCRICGKPVSSGAAGSVSGNSSDNGVTPGSPRISPPARGENPTGHSRAREYAGRVYNCPNCGEPLPSFATNCPSCGAEIRGIGSSRALEVFQSKVDLYTYKPEAFPYDESSFPELLETPTDGEDERKRKRSELEKRLEEKKEEHEDREAERKSIMDKQLADLIKGYSVPNTKEDMLEFLFFAYSHLDFDRLRSFSCSASEVMIANAWFGMIRQIYMRAGHSFQNEDEFARIAEIYNECAENLEQGNKKRHRKRLFFWVGIALFVVVLILLAHFRT